MWKAAAVKLKKSLPNQQSIMKWIEPRRMFGLASRK